MDITDTDKVTYMKSNVVNMDILTCFEQIEVWEMPITTIFTYTKHNTNTKHFDQHVDRTRKLHTDEHATSG